MEERPWLSFLRALRERAGCDVAAIVLRLSRLGVPPFTIWDHRPSIDRDIAREADLEHARLGHLDPLRNALVQPGDIHTLDEVISREELLETEFYRKVMRPYGVEYELGMYISEPGGWECNVGLMNGPRQRDFGADEKRFFLAIRPHLEISLALFARIQRFEAERRIHADTLDKLTIATFILDGSGRVIGSNRIAERLAVNGTVRLIGGRLLLNRTEQNAALQAMIDKAVKRGGQRGGAPTVAVLRVEGREGQAGGLLVRSVSAHLYQGDAAPGAIVYVTGFENREPPERIVAQVFGLTSSEAQLATQLSRGLTLMEAAQTLGLAENTVRSYLKSIFGKTGVNRQAELVRLILQSVAVLG